MKPLQSRLFRLPRWLMRNPGRMVLPVLAPVAYLTHSHQVPLDPIWRDVIGVAAAMAFGVAFGRHFQRRLLSHGRAVASIVWPIPTGILATVGVTAVLVPWIIPHFSPWATAGACGFLLLVITFGYQQVFDPSGRERGRAAEDQVAAILEGVVQRHPGEYYLINNLLLQDAEHSTEIDHVLIGPEGAYVIETKAFRHVFIDAEGTWFSGQGDHPVRIADPVAQNRGHVKAVKAVLGNGIPCASLVVLTTTGKNLRGYAPKQVVRAEDLDGLIEVLHPRGKARYGPDQVQDIGQRLEAVCRTDPASWQEHLRRIEAKQAAAIASFS